MLGLVAKVNPLMVSNRLSLTLGLFGRMPPPLRGDQLGTLYLPGVALLS